MAEYVVVDKEQLEADLTTVADSIREKANVTEDLAFPLGMKEVVESIDTPKEEQEKTISITENGTTEVTPDEGKVLSKVTVNTNVESGGGSGVDLLAHRIDPNLGEYEYYSETVTVIEERGFGQDNSVKKISLPNCKILYTQCCYSTQNLQEVEFPSVNRIVGTQHFQASKLVNVSFPNLGNPTPTYAASAGFNNCYYLEKVDYGYLNKLQANSFNCCYQFKSLVIRRTGSVATLNSISAFTNCYHFYGTVNETYNPNGLQDGYVYVPRDLIESYQTATNWSTLYASHPNVFRALEDYTVDGTITGELDESKI